MKVMDGRSTWAGYRILLVAMAIQGLTPDYANLASSRLSRLVASGWTTRPAADVGRVPSSAPIPRDDQDDGPGEICSRVTVESPLRVRLDAGGRRCIHFLSIVPFERPSRWAPRAFDPTGGDSRGSQGLIARLCRFVC